MNLYFLYRPNTSGVRAGSPFSSSVGSPRERSRSPMTSQTSLTTTKSDKVETVSRERSSSPLSTGPKPVGIAVSKVEATSRERSSSPLSTGPKPVGIAVSKVEATSRERSSSPLSTGPKPVGIAVSKVEATSRERSSSPLSTGPKPVGIAVSKVEATSRERSSSPHTKTGSKPVSRPSHQDSISRAPHSHGRTSKPTKNSRSAPRLNMSVARQNILSHVNRGGGGGRGSRRTMRDSVPGQGEKDSQSEDYSHQLVSG